VLLPRHAATYAVKEEKLHLNAQLQKVTPYEHAFTNLTQKTLGDGAVSAEADQSRIAQPLLEVSGAPSCE